MTTNTEIIDSQCCQ